MSPRVARGLLCGPFVPNDHRRATLSIVAGLLGEALREIAVLITVFAPLDAFTRTTGLTAGMVFATIAGVAVLFGVGVLLEVKRP